MATVLEETRSKTIGADVYLRVPRGLRYQLIFRREVSSSLPQSEVEGMRFVFCNGVKNYVKHLRQILRQFGTRMTGKGMAKLLTKSRKFYFVTNGSEILHYGWVNVSLCKYYWIEKEAAVIGSIWTAEAARGRGIATVATASAINELFGLGHSILYIDTSDTNYSCLKVIGNCGFGAPIASYILGNDTQAD